MFLNTHTHTCMKLVAAKMVFAGDKNMDVRVSPIFYFQNHVWSLTLTKT